MNNIFNALLNSYKPNFCNLEISTCNEYYKKLTKINDSQIPVVAFSIGSCENCVNTLQNSNKCFLGHKFLNLKDAFPVCSLMSKSNEELDALTQEDVNFIIHSQDSGMSMQPILDITKKVIKDFQKVGRQSNDFMGKIGNVIKALEQCTDDKETMKDENGNEYNFSCSNHHPQVLQFMQQGEQELQQALLTKHIML